MQIFNSAIYERTIELAYTALVPKQAATRLLNGPNTQTITKPLDGAVTRKNDDGPRNRDQGQQPQKQTLGGVLTYRPNEGGLFIYLYAKGENRETKAVLTASLSVRQVPGYLSRTK